MEDSRFSESTHCGAARILHALNREFKVQRTFAGVCAAVSGRNISVSLSQFGFPTKHATNSLAGSCQLVSGAAYCSTQPPFRTAMRSLMLIVSV